MDFLRRRHVPIILLLAALAGCTQPQNTQELKEKTAQATAEVKHDAEAVAAGIREGWSRKIVGTCRRLRKFILMSSFPRS